MALPFEQVLVTGAGAFIGGALSAYLSNLGVSVHVLTLDGEMPDVLKNKSHVALHRGDITNQAAMESLFQEVRPEVVFNLAAYGTLTRERDPGRLIGVNVWGVQNLLAVAAQSGCQTFIHTGSIKEYACSRVMITEEQPLQPWDMYAATKAASEFFCQLTSRTAGLRVRVLRLCPVYGLGDTPGRFVPEAISAALAGRPFTISVGSLVRNFTYIDDTVEAYIRAAEFSEPGCHEFNIGSSEIHSFDDILAAAEAVTHRKITRMVAPPASLSDDSWVVSSGKAKQLLGWEAKVDFRSGIERAVEWQRFQVRV